MRKVDVWVDSECVHGRLCNAFFGRIKRDEHSTVQYPLLSECTDDVFMYVRSAEEVLERRFQGLHGIFVRSREGDGRDESHDTTITKYHASTEAEGSEDCKEMRKLVDPHVHTIYWNVGNKKINSTVTPLVSTEKSSVLKRKTKLMRGSRKVLAFSCFFDTAQSTLSCLSVLASYWPVRLDRLPSTPIQRCVWAACEILWISRMYSAKVFSSIDWHIWVFSVRGRRCACSA